MADRVIEELDEAESLRLISAGGIGRIAYQSRFGPAVLPVNYRWHDGAVVFRTTRHSALDEDLQTGISAVPADRPEPRDRPSDPARLGRLRLRLDGRASNSVVEESSPPVTSTKVEIRRAASSPGRTVAGAYASYQVFRVS